MKRLNKDFEIKEEACLCDPLPVWPSNPFPVTIEPIWPRERYLQPILEIPLQHIPDVRP